MISSFSLLFISALLSPLAWRRGAILKILAIFVLFVALFLTGLPIGLEGFLTNGASTLFASIVLIVLIATAIHSDSEATITQILFLASASIALLQSKTLLSFIISFEALSIISVALVSNIRSQDEAEGAVKIFIAGAIATAILMLGAFFYTLDGGKLTEPLKSSYGFYGVAGVATMLFAIFYKLTIVPMHNWAVDTYSLVKANHASLLSGTAKTVATLGAFLLFSPALKEIMGLTTSILLALAIFTMTLGNFMALFRKELARILAWSSVAHAGYMLLGFIAISSQRAEAGVLMMLIAYIFMQSAVFLVLDFWRKRGIIDLDSISGLGRKEPLIATLFTIQLFSLAGIPLLAGFMGKAVLFYAVVDAGFWWVALIALLNSALSVGYYAWIIKQLWFDEAKRSSIVTSIPAPILFSQLILLGGTIYFGIFIGAIFDAIN